MAQTPAPTIAYYTVVDDERTGWTGGLLLLNKGGRPIEFQCTLPVRPTRAHEILFGETLRAHLIGEVIGPLLIKKCRTPISILCCDQHESTIMREQSPFPIAVVREAKASSQRREESTHIAASPTSQPEVKEQQPSRSKDGTTVLLAGSRLLVRDDQLEQVRELSRQLRDLPDAVEPFERIREAIKEAQSQIARATTSRLPNAA